MGDVRRFEPNPPAEESESVDIASFNLKMVQVSVDPRKKSIERFKVELPMQVRALHMRDVEFGPSWRALLKDFDERLLSFSLVYGSVASCGYHSLIRLSNSYREFTVITDFGKFSSKRNHLNQQI